MTDPVVRFSGVSKSFDSTAVLREVDLSIGSGQFLGLAGLNGAGKTTLIKCLLDFCSIDAGSIEIHGLPNTDPRSRSRIAFLPERFAPPYFLTGREFVRGIFRLAGQPYDEQTAQTIFCDLDLASAALDKPVRSYSKGMTQKLGLAACLLSGRDLFILDEPMSGLDPSARARLKRLLSRLRNEGRTLLLTSHSLADIQEICDHMVILHGGRIEFSGTPAALGKRYGEKMLENAFLKCIQEPLTGAQDDGRQR